ncbi:GNAT family N-acetyltransferase [Virgibacillus chiguensis]|uniref:Ribosomal-protein-alanine N-acetyltransferase n=1 Tax=Virgibacillus chiguensis TaxID=411959 RepID=A0A1M5TRT7_9BACI|nr:GNAT family N-acetyltransferase [Virgibacillus chiguensis]SHH53477.1 ribosomal-protein-alanine N-acetyltransferase [Virgibacillus chiguensis]
MKIETKRLLLVPCTEENVNMVLEREQSVGNHIYQHIEKLQEDQSQFGWGPWLICNKENTLLIGNAGFKGKPGIERSVEIGYGIMDDARNQGYATEAVGALINWAFAFASVEQIHAECLVTNLPSISVLEKIGMRKRKEADDRIKWILKRTSVNEA